MNDRAVTGDTSSPRSETAGAGSASVFAPATVANVGPGFDCFGFALETPGDVVRVRATPTTGIQIESIAGDDNLLPRAAAKNTAAVAAAAIWRDAPPTDGALGLSIRIEKGLPAGSGLGSSAASAAAGAAAAMHLLMRITGESFDDARVLAAALDGEAVASHCRHADNVAPALRGGFTIVQPGDPPVIARFIPALPLVVAVVTPRLEIRTRDARRLLPKTVPLADAVANWSAAAALVHALMAGKPALIRGALVDRVVTPHRGRLIPGFDAARRAAEDAGALGASISGSGPSIFALALDQTAAEAAAEAMADVLARHDLESTRMVSPIASQGARLV